jgi:hypothetical protein
LFIRIFPKLVNGIAQEAVGNSDGKTDRQNYYHAHCGKKSRHWAVLYLKYLPNLSSDKDN